MEFTLLFKSAELFSVAEASVKSALGHCNVCKAVLGIVAHSKEMHDVIPVLNIQQDSQGVNPRPRIQGDSHLL